MQLLPIFDKSTPILELEIFKKCNLKCSYCCAESNLQVGNIDQDLRFKQILALLNALPSGTWIRLMGGEPCLFKYIQELVDYANCKFIGFTLFSNCTKKLPNLQSSNIVITSLHYEYPKLWDVIYNNTEDLPNPVIYNVMVKDFEDYNLFSSLEQFILKVKNIPNKFIHAQIITSDNYKPSYSNLLKWRTYLKSLGAPEFYDQYFNYDQKIKEFFKSRVTICNSHTTQYSDKLRNDCDKLKVGETGVICRSKTCYYDNCLYI